MLRDVPRVQAVEAAFTEGPQVLERFAGVRLDASGARLVGHRRIQIDAVAADPAVAQELEERAAAAAEIEDPRPPGEAVHERLRLAADDRLVAGEARREKSALEAAGDLVLAPAFPFTLEAREPLVELGRRRLPKLDDCARQQLVDALLPIGDRCDPPAHEPDDRAPAEGDRRAHDAPPARRVVRRLLGQGVLQRGERIAERVAEERAPAGQRHLERGAHVVAVRAARALALDPLADLSLQEREVHGSLVHGRSLPSTRMERLRRGARSPIQSSHLRRMVPMSVRESAPTSETAQRNTPMVRRRSR